VGGTVNLTLNILFVTFLPPEYKLDGVIFSTIVSFVVIQIPWETHVVFTAYFNKEQGWHYLRAQFGSAAWTLALGAATWASASAIALDGLPGLAVKGAVALVASGGLTGIFFRHEMAALVNRIRRRC
jgi:hypothetical protein